MKRIFTIILALIATACFSQSYRAITSGQVQYFRISNNLSGNFPFNLNSATWSQVKGISFDSTIATGTDTAYFGFRTWRDTTTLFGNGLDCADSAGPSWMGDPIEISGASMNTFYNYWGKAIHIDGAAAVNDSWTCYNYKNGNTIRAHVDSIARITIAGITDSAKYISMNELNSGGLPVLSPVNSVQLILSKDNGFLRLVSFREFPMSIYILDRIPFIPLPTQMDIFDFNINDEFEYTENCISPNPVPSRPPTYTYDRILNKWYSISMDTVYYVRFRRIMDLELSFTPSPHIDTIFYSRQDTLLYTNTLFLTTYPEENYKGTFGTFDNYTLSMDTSRYHNRPVYSVVDGIGFIYGVPPADSCYLLNHFEPVGNSHSYSPGLGLCEWIDDQVSMSGWYCTATMTWYHKGSETDGTYINIPTGLNEIEDPVTGIFPNPASESCQINFSHPVKTTIQLLDVAGKNLQDMKADAKSVMLDLTGLANGIYLVRIQTPAGTFFRKVSKQ